jgi:hypothetical protein
MGIPQSSARESIHGFICDLICVSAFALLRMSIYVKIRDSSRVCRKKNPFLTWGRLSTAVWDFEVKREDAKYGYAVSTRYILSAYWSNIFAILSQLRCLSILLETFSAYFRILSGAIAISQDTTRCSMFPSVLTATLRFH